MTTITIMRPGADTETQPIEVAAKPGYLALKSIVAPFLNGGMLEHVTVLHDGKRADMFVDDEGLLKGLPRNDAATVIYRNNWLTAHPKDDPESLPAIYGPAVLFSRQVWF